MKKKVISVVLSSAMVLSLLAGCAAAPAASAPAPAEESAPAATEEAAPAEAAAEETAEAPASEGGKVFGYTCMDGTNPFFVALEGAIREVVESHGDTLVSVNPLNDSNTQIDQVEDLISKGIDYMFVNPVDADGIIPALDMLKEANIPIFGFDTQVGDMSYLVSYAGSDNYNAGFVCGEDLVKKLPDGGDILVLDSPTMQSVTDRVNGFMDAIDGKGFNVVGQQDAVGNLQVAQEKCTDLLTAHPDVVAIFGGNDPTALGCLAAAEAAGVKPLIYGVDGSPDIKAELKKPESAIEGTGAQSPVTIGKTIAETAYDWIDGKDVEEFIPIETFLITADNVDEYGTDGWQ